MLSTNLWNPFLNPECCRCYHVCWFFVVSRQELNAVNHTAVLDLAFSECFAVCLFSDKAAPPELPIVIDHIALKDILGPPVFEMEVSRERERAACAVFIIHKFITETCRIYSHEHFWPPEFSGPQPMRLVSITIHDSIKAACEQMSQLHTAAAHPVRLKSFAFLPSSLQVMWNLFSMYFYEDWKRCFHVCILAGLWAAHPAWCSSRPGLDAAWWGDHVCGGQSDGGRRSAHSHGSAGRRYERICPLGHQLAQSEC